MICQRIGDHMRVNRSGVIINIASDVAVISPDHRIYEPNPTTGYEGMPFNTPLAYSVSKTGILGMTRYLSTYWAKDGVRVNAISPAGVYRQQAPDFVDELVSRIPMGRMANLHELKGPIVFLASDASSFITGANLIVDGGRTIW
jgi:NAD(P)-dependent dehydrogenase (short-subunit alcohol dehydrogenase family)